jgi:hypothetical protein
VLDGWPGADDIKNGSGSRNLRAAFSLSMDNACFSPIYLATSRLPLTPFRASPLTRSILDMILIHGTLKFTMEDMADMTPLYIVFVRPVTTFQSESSYLKYLYLSSINCESSR